MFYDQKPSKLSEVYYLEPSPYPSFRDIVEAMNTLIQQRHNHSESRITIEVSRRSQNLTFTLQMKDVVLDS